jgi:hypothetical protein
VSFENNIIDFGSLHPNILFQGQLFENDWKSALEELLGNWQYYQRYLLPKYEGLGWEWDVSVRLGASLETKQILDLGRLGRDFVLVFLVLCVVDCVPGSMLVNALPQCNAH